jgi:four helix bundle protein
MKEINNFFEKLKEKMDNYVHFVYFLTKKFPREEIYSTVSQLRRAALSVVLNYIEGFARKRSSVKHNFWEISYGSLKESGYLIEFCYKEKYITIDDFKKVEAMGDEIGAMLWRVLGSIKKEK